MSTTKKEADDGVVTPFPAVPKDAEDFSSLWLDPSLGDGITTGVYHSIPVDKPKAFFRVIKDPLYRRRTQIYTHKIEGQIGDEVYIVDKPMHGFIKEATPCTLVTCIYRDGNLRIWPIKFPRDGERDNETWISARAAAKAALDNWIKLVWSGRAYGWREAAPGYAPEPDLSKLPAWDELVALAFGAKGIIRDKDHPIYREIFGLPVQSRTKSDGDDAVDF
jgi:hypothetical protein